MSEADTSMETGVATAPIPSNGAATAAILALDDDALLEHLQRAAIDYFLHAGNPANGLVADTTREDLLPGQAGLTRASWVHTLGPLETR